MSEIAKTEEKIQKIEKTDLDDGIKAAKKVKIHLVCISIGISLTIGATFIGGIFLHFAIVLPVLPTIAQEAFDYLYKL